MKIIAHRGASYDAPENTLAAVKLAWKHEADGVEIDVHLSRDKQVMVIHDPTTRRTAGGGRAKVMSLTAQQLGLLDAGGWKGKHWAGEPIPRLDQVLALLPPAKELLVEVKCGREFGAAFAKLHTDMGAQAKQVVLIGFDRESMGHIKERFPKHRVFWVTKLPKDLERSPVRLARWIDAINTARLDGVDLDARGRITASLVDRLHQEGLQVYVWTVDSLAQARRLKKVGIDGLTTNRPALIRAGLG